VIAAATAERRTSSIHRAAGGWIPQDNHVRKPETGTGLLFDSGASLNAMLDARRLRQIPPVCRSILHFHWIAA
jgi:hypothetical protein